MHCEEDTRYWDLSELKRFSNKNNWHFKELINNPQDYYLVITNDIDSILSCNYLTCKFGIQVGGYYDFKNLRVNNEISKYRKPIFVDCDLAKGYCFGNHNTLIKNQLAINYNALESWERGKYSGSTILTLISIYEEDKSSLSDEKLLFYSLIDGFFNTLINRKSQVDFWIDIMNLPPRISNVVNDIGEKRIRKLIGDLRLTEKTFLNKYILNWNGDINRIYEEFGIEIKLPKVCLETLIGRYTRYNNIQVNNVSEEHRKLMFSDAIMRLNTISYSIPIWQRIGEE